MQPTVEPYPPSLVPLTSGMRVLAKDAFSNELSGVITRGPWKENPHSRREFAKVTIRFDPDAKDHRGIGGGEEVPWPAAYVRPATEARCGGS